MFSAILNWLFNPAGLTAHGFCLLWEPWLIWINATADAAIGVAYFTIPVAMAVYARRRGDLIYKPVLWLFAAFVLLCGAGHWIQLLTLWIPAYRLEGIEKAATAVASLAAAVAVWLWLPKAVAYPTPSQMREVTDALHHTEAKSEEWLRSIVEASPTALVLTGADGAIKMVNTKAEHMFGYGRAELYEQKLETLVPGAVSGRQLELQCDNLASQGERAIGGGRELRGVRKDGTMFPLEIGLNPIDVAGATMVLAGVSDISVRQAAEQATQLQQQALERSNAELIRARLRAEQGTRAKSRFLAGMSHELRTPLNAILGYAELLRIEGGLNEVQAARVHAMQRAGRHLHKMITNVLDLSEIEAGHVTLHLVAMDLQETAHDCITLVSPAADARGLALSLNAAADLPTHIVADPTRMRQVLLNLLANAVKFTDRGSVTLRLRVVHPAPGDTVLLSEVIDTGRGVPADRKADLFQDFERLGADPDGAIEGAGLGLAISARLANAMGGGIEHADNPGGGSIFSFELPLLIAQGEAGSAAAQSQSALAPAPDGPVLTAPLRVLVVDDIEMNRDITSSFLRAAGHAVTCAVGGAQAVQSAADFDYDVVLMDLRMPEVDGFEATRRIRALGGKRGRPPIVALTAHAFAEQIDECWRAGMVGHLAKPFTQKALLAALADAMSGKHLRQAQAASATGSAALPVIEMDTFETSAAFLPPNAVVSYLEDIVTSLNVMRLNLAERNASEPVAGALADAVHAMAGKVGMFGFVRLTSVARSFEQMARTAEPVPPAQAEEMQAALEATLLIAGRRLDAARITNRAADEARVAKEAVLS